MAVIHGKTDPRGAFTGTLTVFNSQGSTTTVAATDVVGPLDWNSAHNQYVTISSNTGGDSSAATATNVVLAGTNFATVRLSTAAGAATQWISAHGTHTAISEYEPISGSAIATNSSLGQDSIYFVPFYVPQQVYVSRVNFLVSVATTWSNQNSTGRGGLTFSAAMYSRMTAAGSNERISRMWSATLGIAVTAQSRTRISVVPNVTGIADSQSVATENTNVTSSNASTYMVRSIGGYRVYALPMNSTLTPGRYWMAVANSTSSSNAGHIVLGINVGQQTIGGAAQIGYVPVGTSSSASDISQNRAAFYGAGTYSATSGGFPASVPLTTDSIRAGLTLTLPYFNFSGWTTAATLL